MEVPLGAWRWWGATRIAQVGQAPDGWRFPDAVQPPRTVEHGEQAAIVVFQQPELLEDSRPVALDGTASMREGDSPRGDAIQNDERPHGLSLIPVRSGSSEWLKGVKTAFR